MIDHANELRRHARKIPHPQGETPGVMLRAADEIECLRAKIAEMERQEPVMWANSSTINSSRINRERGGCGDQHTCSETQTTYHDTQLYALPGAKGEEK